MLNIVTCIGSGHDPRFVALAVVVCLAACATAVNLLEHAAAERGRRRWPWTAAAAAVLGIGTWTTHFVAILGFHVGVPVGFELTLTIASVAIATCAALAGFGACVLDGMRPRSALAGGVAVGIGIAAMHYSGIAAMRLPGALLFDPAYAIASILVGISAAAAALLLLGATAGAGRRVSSVCCLAFSILGLHFIAMAGLTVVPGPMRPASALVLDRVPLALAVGSAALLLCLLSLLSSVWQHRSERWRREALRLHQLAEVAFEGIAIHRGGLILDVNSALCSLISRRPDELIGRHMLDFVAPASAEAVRRHLARSAPDRDITEASLVRPDGSEIEVEMLTRPIAYATERTMAVAIRDISERQRAEARIRFLAHHDPLTGLANRTLFTDRLAEVLTEAPHLGTSVAVLCFDLDRFKAVNDLLGHRAGDQLLQTIARHLRREVPSTDIVARLGGDEFAVVLTLSPQPAAAASLAERLLQRVDQPFDLDGQCVSVGLSIGIATFPNDGQTGDALLKNADIALYRAKAEGRRKALFFHGAMADALRERQALEHDLRLAMDRNELAIHYQKICESCTMRTIGFEALMRWTHPARGQVPPAEFIPIAEECGLIVPMGLWALETACREATTWPSDWHLAVNLSPVQFRQAGLTADVAAILHRTGLAAERLELEVTEGLLIDDIDAALAMLEGLKALGVRLVLDDFGTGYASLGNLQRFPFDKLKIDRSFIRDLGETPEASAIVQAIVALSRSLRLDVTAEGVETETQLHLLRQQQCSELQGFLFGRPVPPTEITLMPEEASPAA